MGCAYGRGVISPSKGKVAPLDSKLTGAAHGDNEKIQTAISSSV